MHLCSATAVIGNKVKGRVKAGVKAGVNGQCRMRRSNLIRLPAHMPTNPNSKVTSVSIRFPDGDYLRLKHEQQKISELAGFEPSLNVLVLRLVSEALDARDEKRKLAGLD